MKGKNMATETIKVIRTYLDGELEGKEVSVEGEFTPETSVDAAIAKSGDSILAVLNSGLREVFRESLAVQAKAKIPDTAMSDEAYNAMAKPLIEREKALGRKLSEARAKVLAQIKGDESLKSLIRTMTSSGVW